MPKQHKQIPRHHQASACNSSSILAYRPELLLALFYDASLYFGLSITRGVTGSPPLSKMVHQQHAVTHNVLQ